MDSKKDKNSLLSFIIFFFFIMNKYMCRYIHNKDRVVKD